MLVLFPCDYFDKKKIDEPFLAQADAFEQLGFSTAVFSIDDLASGRFASHPDIPEDETVLYRGWMLSLADYRFLETAISERYSSLLTNIEHYKQLHHLPNWFPCISDLTPNTVCFTDLDNIDKELAKLDWSGFFVKDFVKSLKTSVGSRIDSAEQITAVISEMEKFRGQIEGGICVRQIEAFKPETEQRYFVVGKQVYSPNENPIPEIVVEAASRFDSPFFSVDVVERTDGTLRIVEVGDGQVSDLLAWSEERFASLWSN